MPQLRATPDPIADVSSARTEMSGPAPRKPEEIRAAQLVMTSVAMNDITSLQDALLDDALQEEIRDVLSALGIYTKSGKIQMRKSRRLIGVVQTGETPQRGKFPRRRESEEPEREPNGRLSRRRGIYKK
jgi:hypothetical protein